MANLNNDKFEHIEKRVMVYTKRRYERENLTLEFQNKVKRIKERQQQIAIEQKKQKERDMQIEEQKKQQKDKEEEIVQFRRPKIHVIDKKNLIKNEIEEDERKFQYLTRIAGIPIKN